MIHTSDYLRLHGYDKKKFENLQSSDRKIYLFYHTQPHPDTGFEIQTIITHTFNCKLEFF